MHREIRVALPVALLRVGEPRVPDDARRRRLPPCRAAAAGATWRATRTDSTRTVGSPVRVRNSGPSTPITSPRSNRSSSAYAHRRARPGGSRAGSPRLVGEMRERRLAVRAPRHHPPGDAHRPARPVVRAFGSAAIAPPMRRACARTGTRTARCPPPPSASSLARRSRRTKLRSSAAHARAAARSRRACRRYASMNGSIPPSITFCTSGILSSVRWSLTIVYGWNT